MIFAIWRCPGSQLLVFKYISKAKDVKRPLHTRIVIPHAHTSLSSVCMASPSCSSGDVHAGFPMVLGAEKAAEEERTFERPKSATTGIPLLDIKMLSFRKLVKAIVIGSIFLLTPRKSP